MSEILAYFYAKDVFFVVNYATWLTKSANQRQYLIRTKLYDKELVSALYKLNSSFVVCYP